MFTPPRVPRITSNPLVAKTPRAEHSVTYQASFDAWYTLARSYWVAGITLLHSCQTGSRAGSQMLTPAIFLIRHAVELQIKSQILDASGQTRTTPSDKELEVLNGHSLAALWSLLEKRLAVLGVLKVDRWWTRVRQIVGQLDALDRSSMDFRYPISKEGGKLAAGEDIAIDVANFVAVLEELDLMLEGISAWIDELRGAGDH